MKVLALFLFGLLLLGCKNTSAEVVTDEGTKVSYDYKSVCDFGSGILENPQSFFSKKEWLLITHGRENGLRLATENPFKIYKHNDIFFEYLPKEHKPEVWDIFLKGKRLPENMRSLSYFLSYFKIQLGAKLENPLNLGCDAIEVIIHHHKQKVLSVRVSVDKGVI